MKEEYLKDIEHLNDAGEERYSFYVFTYV